MNYEVLKEKRDLVRKNIGILPDVIISNFEKDFVVGYTHNSTAIEGNTLSLLETKLVLEDQQSIGGKSLREIYEVVDHAAAFSYVKKNIEEGKALDENTIKDIHEILMDKIFQGGIYRSTEVRIVGAAHTPPPPNEMYVQIKNFYADLTGKTLLDPIELAAWTHAEFVKIHPFPDGNGRTSRLIMNYQLMVDDFLPVSIMKEQRLSYFESLEQYAINGNLAPFTDMIADLENARLDQYIRAIEMQQENDQSQQLI
jgi:Fic family protein